MDRLALGRENETLAVWIELELNALIVLPRFRNRQRNLEPVVGPRRPELIADFGQLVVGASGLGERWRGASLGRPALELDCLLGAIFIKVERR